MAIELELNCSTKEYTREIIRDTINETARILASSLGPYGTSTMIQDRFLGHYFTKDGYTILKNLYSTEPRVNMVLEFLKRIARRLVIKVGDGTTSSIVIASHLYNEFERIEPDHQCSPKEFIDTLNRITEFLITEINRIAIPIRDGFDKLEQIAYISTNNNERYGRLLREIFETIGRDGFINLDTAIGSDSYYEVTDGFELDSGYINPVMINRPNEKICELREASVFMCDDVLREADMKILFSVLSRVCLQSKQPLVIIAKDYDYSISYMLHENVIKSKLPILAVTIALNTGNYRDRFDDVALTLGCQPYMKTNKESFPNNVFPLERLGSCKKVISSQRSTRFIEGNGDPVLINERIKHIKTLIEQEYRKERYLDTTPEIIQLRKRLSILTPNMAILYVGGYSEESKVHDKFLLEDAISACRSALEHGYIIGGNMTIPVIISKLIRGKRKWNKLVKDDLTKILLVSILTAFTNSYRTILEKAYDRETTNGIIGRCITSRGYRIYNMITDRYESLHSKHCSVINSAETDIEILKTAVSIIAMMLQSEQIIYLPK